jgi:class 3 adenylate cyclase
MDIPDVRYARQGGVAIACQIVGDGPHDVVYASHFDLFTLWLTPRMRDFFVRLMRDARLIVFNPRGVGLSDRPRNVTLEARMDDILAVLDAAESRRATLFGVDTSANVCALFAATYPERCERLILADPYPRAVRSDTYQHGDTEDDWLLLIRNRRERWGDRDYLEDLASSSRRGENWAPPELARSGVGELDWYVWQLRLSMSPAAAADFARMAMETDITSILSSIRIPTLVFQHEDTRGPAGFVSERIRDARTIELRHLYVDGGADAIVQFLHGKALPAVPDSVLATVLFTDLVGSTEQSAELGDRVWRDVLSRHHEEVRKELARHRGEEVDSAGDGFFCRFDGPARAIACARRIVDGATELGLQVRAGIHTGECEVVGEKIAGIAVVTGSRISSLAASGEVLVSSTVKDLVAGSGFAFEDRGKHDLKGVPGEWHLYAVTGPEAG